MKKGKGISVSCVCLSTEYKPEERKEFYQTLKREFHEARGETEGKYKVLYVESEGKILTSEDWEEKYRQKKDDKGKGKGHGQAK